jgi:hypothetical protein
LMSAHYQGGLISLFFVFWFGSSGSCNSVTLPRSLKYFSPLITGLIVGHGGKFGGLSSGRTYR